MKNKNLFFSCATNNTNNTNVKICPYGITSSFVIGVDPYEENENDESIICEFDESHLDVRYCLRHHIGYIHNSPYNTVLSTHTPITNYTIKLT